MRTYRGYFENDIPRVTVRDERRPVVLTHHKRYSSNPLNWNDDADLGKDLARSILLDAFGITTCNDIECVCESKWVESVYEKFYEEIIRNLKPKNEWRMTQYSICDFAFEHRLVPVLEPTA